VHDWAALVERATSAPDREAAAKMARESSPVSSVTTWRSPVLTITGDDDDNVPVLQSVDLFHRLRAARVPVEQLVLPDQPHFMPLWRTWVTVYAATTDFVERTLVKGETIGVPH
jgi:dipeptidyl aminopeptidase/acylaminoacyl peptidase